MGFIYNNLKWVEEYDINGNIELTTLCFDCNCVLIGTMRDLSCPKCEKSYHLNEPIGFYKHKLEKIIESEKYKNIQFINIDNELVPILNEDIKDSTIWVRTSVKENARGKKQVMILVGDRNEKNKAQLFVVPEDERVGFDQTNDHPAEVLAKVEVTFKNSKTVIKEKK